MPFSLRLLCLMTTLGFSTVFGCCDLKNKKWHKFCLAPGPVFVCLFVPAHYGVGSLVPAQCSTHFYIKTFSSHLKVEAHGQEGRLRGSVRAEGPGAALEQQGWSQDGLKQGSWAEESNMGFRGGEVLRGQKWVNAQGCVYSPLISPVKILGLILPRR